MQNPTRTSAPLVLALGTAFLLGALALQLLTGPGQPAASTTTDSPSHGEELGDELRAIHDQLVQLNGLLEGQGMSLPRSSGAPAGRAGDRELVAALQALTQALELARDGGAAGLAAAGAPAGTAPLQRRGSEAMTQTARRALMVEYRRDSEEALDRMFGMSVRDVFEELGRPSYANMSEGGVIWHYSDIGPEEENLSIYIHDGVVVNILG
ncbi:MAG: hypothetical protein P1V81_03990 [Planctomycetota bacterium]|nr:hypothetical protein [Planctomycetota bacterium]